MESDLREMLAAWMGGDLEPAEAERLLARLRDDSDFRLAFVAEIRMLGMLKAVQSSEPRWLRLEDELGWSALQTPDDDASAVEEEFARRLSEGPKRPSHAGRRRPAWLKPAAAAAAVLAAAALVYWVAPRRGEVPPAPVVDLRGPSALIPPIAMLVQSDSACWETSGGPPPAVGEILRPRRLELLEGRATLSMLNGVRLVVEGPADLDLMSVDQVHCRRGRLRARGRRRFRRFRPGLSGRRHGDRVRAQSRPRGRGARPGHPGEGGGRGSGAIRHAGTFSRAGREAELQDRPLRDRA